MSVLTTVAFQSFYVSLSKIYVVFCRRKKGGSCSLLQAQSFLRFALEIRYTTSFEKIRFVGSFTKILVDHGYFSVVFRQIV